MDNRRRQQQPQHEDQCNSNSSHQQRGGGASANKNKNKKKNQQHAPTTPVQLGSTVPPPLLGSASLTPGDTIKFMQKEREEHAAGAGHGQGHVHGHADVNSNNNEPGSGSNSSANTNNEVLDNHAGAGHGNGNGEVSPTRSTSVMSGVSGFVSASEGDDAFSINSKLNNSNSSTASATFTDAREEETDDYQNGNLVGSEDEDESNTPIVEEYTHASMIVNLSSDNSSSIDFRERRARVDISLPDPDEDSLCSARSAPPDLSHDHDKVDDDDDEVQIVFTSTSTPNRPLLKSKSGSGSNANDSIPVVTLDSTLEAEDSVDSKNPEESLSQSQSFQNRSEIPEPVEVSPNSSAMSSDANTTTTTLDKEKLGNTTQEINNSNSTAGGNGDKSQSALEVVEEVQAQPPEVAAEAGLPKTVTILQATNGATVYLVGTAHFSEASQDDVIKTIREVQPKAVFLELCQARQHILIYDEETILREASNIDMEKIRFAIRKSGAVQGALHLLLLSISSNITKKLGMAPGGEFRVGFREAQQLRHQCDIIFGDRAFAVTLARALHSLSFWQKVKLGWQFLTTPNDITKEEIERCKEKDILEQMLEEMVGEYPSISNVFVGERDIYLAHSLWLSALATDGPVVGIVGIGHVPGMIKQWGKTNESQVNEVNQMPKTSTTSIVIRKTIRIGFYCLVGYGVYRVGSRMLGGTRLASIQLPEAVSTRLAGLRMSSFSKAY